MNDLHAMTRRGVLRCIAAAVLPLCLPLAARRRTYGAHIGALFSTVGSARRIGRAFLALHPEERNRARLAELTAADLAVRDATAWRAWLAQQRRQELRDEQVVEIDGWVLAFSEARLCALLVVKSNWF